MRKYCSRNTMENTRGSFIRIFHILTETSFLNRVIKHGNGASRLKIGKIVPCCLSCGLTSDVGRFFLLAAATSLNAEDTTLCRSVTVRFNYLNLDLPGLSFAAGFLARGMKSPTTKGLEELKRVGRHLRGLPVGAIEFEPQTFPGVSEVFRDADHAGDLGTRNSLSVWSAFDQARECSAKHHCTEQKRMETIRVAQVVNPCARDQSNAERARADNDWGNILMCRLCCCNKQNKKNVCRCQMSRKAKICRIRLRIFCPRVIQVVAVDVNIYVKKHR